MEYGMKKLLIPAFACAAMFTACGDDSSSTSSEAVESSSSVADASSSSVVAESSSSDWAHEGVGDFACFSASDSTTGLKYSYEGPDSAMEVVSYVYPKLGEDVEKVCEEAKANKTDEQEVTCSHRVEISNQPKTMTFDSFKALMTEECYNGIAINLVHITDPNKAPENFSFNEIWEDIKRAFSPGASSSASSDVAKSSSSVVAESSSSDWAHEKVGDFFCFSASDSTVMLRYEYEGADNAMEVVSYVYPKMFEDVDKVCEEAMANKTDEQEVTCEKHVTIINPLKTMSFDALVSLMEKECEAGSIMNSIDLVDPDEAPENAKQLPKYCTLVGGGKCNP